MTRRGVRLAGALVLLVAVAGVAWSAGRGIETPADRAAASAPPPPTVLTASVERRSSVQVPVRLRAAPVERFSITSVPVLAGASPVVTDLPATMGSKVDEGQRLLSVTGRPVIALRGSVSSYRDVRALDRGPDVAQIEGALVRLGMLAEPADDVYGEATKAAVRELYRRAGAAPIEVVPEGASREELEAAVLEAQAAVDAAVDAGDVAAHREAVASRRRARKAVDAVLEASGPLIPKDELAFVPRLPLVVDAVAVRLGKLVPEGEVMALRSSDLRFDGVIDRTLASLVEPGQDVELDAAARPFTGSVERVAAEPSEEGTFALVVAPGAEVPADLVGREVVGQIEVLSTDAPVLTVPVAALIARADGSTIVVRRRPDGSEQEVTVATGRDFDGMVEVDPTAGRLSGGDQVVIGR